MSPEQRKTRRRNRRSFTKVMAFLAVRDFLEHFEIQPSYSTTKTRELAALCKAGHRIARIAEDAQKHLDKRHDAAKASLAKLQGNV